MSSFLFIYTTVSTGSWPVSQGYGSIEYGYTKTYFRHEHNNIFALKTDFKEDIKLSINKIVIFLLSTKTKTMTDCIKLVIWCLCLCFTLLFKDGRLGYSQRRSVHEIWKTLHIVPDLTLEVTSLFHHCHLFPVWTSNSKKLYLFVKPTPVWWPGPEL